MLKFEGFLNKFARVAASAVVASGLWAQQQPASPRQGAPVVEEEEPVKPGKPGAPVVEEEEPVKPAKPGAPVVEEEAPVRPSKPGAPVVEEEEPVKPAKPGAPVVEEEAPAQTATQGAPKVEEESTPTQDQADQLLQAPSVIALPRLDLRLFADVGFVHEKVKGEATEGGFGIGAFDLFASSKLNDKVTVLVEALFEREGREYLVDLERAVFRYRHNKYLNFDMGRFHSSISYYNSTYHHGRWFETAAERPFIAEWEDDKGILPSHGVGVQVSGALPSPEALPLSYSFELTNGRGFADGRGSVLSGEDVDTFKATNIGLVAKPAALPGLQLGTSVYNDRWRPTPDTRWRERIYAFHAIYQRGRYQFLNEFVHLRHRPMAIGSAPLQNAGSRVSVMSGFYSQFGYRIGKIVPFTRVDWLNARHDNPIARSAFGENTGIRKEWIGGFFFDLTSFSALKFQVDRAWTNRIPKVEAIVQLAFAF